MVMLCLLCGELLRCADGGVGERQVQRIARLREPAQEAADALRRGEEGDVFDLGRSDVGLGREIDKQQAAQFGMTAKDVLMHDGGGKLDRSAVLDGGDVMLVGLAAEQCGFAEQAAGAHEPQRALQAVVTAGGDLERAGTDQEDAVGRIARMADDVLARPGHLAAEREDRSPRRLVLEKQPGHLGAGDAGFAVHVRAFVTTGVVMTTPYVFAIDDARMRRRTAYCMRQGKAVARATALRAASVTGLPPVTAGKGRLTWRQRP